MQLNDNRGYGHFAALHGAPPPVECPHNSPLFLPWHRAYLYFFEMSLRDLRPNVTLPWWDWTSGRLPPAWTDLAAGNPLASAAIPQRARVSGEGPRTVRGSLRQLPNAAQVDAALARDDFLDFNDAVEQLHNQVHGAIGGSMGSINTAAYDPIFWVHHCFVDRLWRLWQLRHSGSGLPNTLLDQALAPFPVTVRQTVSVTSMGYDYARATISAPFKAAA